MEATEIGIQPTELLVRDRVSNEDERESESSNIGSSTFSGMHHNEERFGAARLEESEPKLALARLGDSGVQQFQFKPKFQSPSRRFSETFYRNLAVKGRGSPLFIPIPNSRRSIHSRRIGVSIGDVGVITNAGLFDSLFNICLPADNPINPQALPADFVPLPPLESNDIVKYPQFEPGTCLSNHSLKTFQVDIGIPGLTFEHSIEEEVKFTLPQGSMACDLINTTSFRKHLAANALSWYKYVITNTGRGARNGDLRLVVGWDHASAWEVTTSSTITAPEMLGMRIEANGELTLGQKSRSSTVETGQRGPHLEELALLRGGDPSEEGAVYANQRHFLRTLNISVNDELRLELARELLRLFPIYEHLPAHTEEPAKPFVNSRSSTLGVHPANALNAKLLEIKPTAKLAITEDKEWISVLKPDDLLLPSAEDLLSRVLEVYDVHEEDGIAFLKRKVESLCRTATREARRNDSVNH